MVRLLESGRLSLNVGGNDELVAGTLAWKLDLPVSLHGGATYPWKNIGNLDFRAKPGIFAGFEIRF
jgi:N-acetylneuraminic acid mutarotase